MSILKVSILGTEVIPLGAYKHINISYIYLRLWCFFPWQSNLKQYWLSPCKLWYCEVIHHIQQDKKTSSSVVVLLSKYFHRKQEGKWHWRPTVCLGDTQSWSAEFNKAEIYRIHSCTKVPLFDSVNFKGFIALEIWGQRLVTGYEGIPNTLKIF